MCYINIIIVSLRFRLANFANHKTNDNDLIMCLSCLKIIIKIFKLMIYVTAWIKKSLLNICFFFLGYIFSNIRLRCIRHDFLHIFKQHIVLQFLEWFNLDEIRIDDKWSFSKLIIKVEMVFQILWRSNLTTPLDLWPQLVNQLV